MSNFFFDKTHRNSQSNSKVMNDIKTYVNQMIDIKKTILKFIEGKNEPEMDIKDITKFFNDHQIRENKYKILSVLNILVRISCDHHRFPSLFNKIGQIILDLQNDIKKNLQKEEIFDIFRKNKRILLLAIELKLIVVDKFFVEELKQKRKYISDKYDNYFSKEIQLFKHIKNVNDDNKFDEKRKIGENDNPLCEIIRKDSIKEFLIFVNSNDLQIRNFALSMVEPSIFETNRLLLRSSAKIIEYAAFFGSIKIFKCLAKYVKLKPSIWLYAIHSNSAEMIHLLEEQNVYPPCGNYEECYREAALCYHDEILYYFVNNYLMSSHFDSLFCSVAALKSYNFEFYNSKVIRSYTFSLLCKYNHYDIVKLILNSNIGFDGFFYEFDISILKKFIEKMLTEQKF